MVSRVLLGPHPSLGMGGYVSKPGFDVVGASKFNMMWSTVFEQLQIAQSGSFVIIGSGRSSPQYTPISWTDQGFFPLILFSSDEYEVLFEYTSTSTGSARRVMGNSEVNSLNSDNTNRTVYYVVTRTPLL